MLKDEIPQVIFSCYYLYDAPKIRSKTILTDLTDSHSIFKLPISSLFINELQCSNTS